MRWPSPPGQGGGTSIQGEVAEAYVVQEAQAFADLLQHLLGDDGILALQRQFREPAARLAHALAHHIGDVQTAHEDSQNLGLEAPTPAVLARNDAHGLLHLRLISSLVVSRGITGGPGCR